MCNKKEKKVLIRGLWKIFNERWDNKVSIGWTAYRFQVAQRPFLFVSPTSGGRSVGIVRWGTKATELVRSYPNRFLDPEAVGKPAQKLSCLFSSSCAEIRVRCEALPLQGLEASDDGVGFCPLAIVRYSKSINETWISYRPQVWGMWENTLFGPLESDWD
jgi:hypothetical protein